MFNVIECVQTHAFMRLTDKQLKQWLAIYTYRLAGSQYQQPHQQAACVNMDQNWPNTVASGSNSKPTNHRSPWTVHLPHFSVQMSWSSSQKSIQWTFSLRGLSLDIRTELQCKVKVCMFLSRFCHQTVTHVTKVRGTGRRPFFVFGAC